MSKCLLHLLQALSIATAINIFIFDKQTRKFRSNLIWKRLIQRIYKISYLPMLALTTAICVTLFYFMGIVIEANFRGSKGFYYAAGIGTSLIYLKKSTGSLAICLVYRFNFLLSNIERLLNNFVSAYDLYVRLIDTQLRVRWITFALMSSKLIFSDLVIWFVLSRVNFVFSLVYILLALHSLVLSLVIVWGLVFLHALFHGTHAAVHNLTWTKPKHISQMKQLVRFYCALLRLRSDFEVYISGIISLELIWEAVCLVALTCFLFKFGYVFFVSLVVPIFLVYPMGLASLSHDICHIENRLGNDLLQFNSEHNSTAKDQLLQTFCLQKFVMSKGKNATFGVLHLRREFILVFLNSIWVNAMFMYSIYFSSKYEKTYFSAFLPIIYRIMFIAMKEFYKKLLIISDSR